MSEYLYFLTIDFQQHVSRFIKFYNQPYNPTQTSSSEPANIFILFKIIIKKRPESVNLTDDTLIADQ